MGFFVAESQIAESASNKRPTKAPSSRAAVGCDACGLRPVWASILSPRMKIAGPRDADVLILGSNLTQADDAAGKPWSAQGEDLAGGAADLVRRAIPSYWRDRVAYQSMVRCFPNRGLFGDLRHAHACSVHLIEDIESRPITHILAIGSMAVQYFLSGEQIHEIYGTRVPVKIGSKTVWIYPVFDPAFVYQAKGKFDDGPIAPVFFSDIKRFFAELDRWPAPEVVSVSPDDVLLPQSYEEAKQLIAGMQGGLGYDIETSHLKPMRKDSKILTASFSDANCTIAFPVLHPERSTEWGERLILETLEEREWIAHNAGFELVWSTDLALRYGRKPKFKPFQDSMAMGRVYHNRNSLLDLGSLTRIHLGVNIKSLSPVNAARIMEYPIAEVLPYNGLDAFGSAKISHKILDEVQGDNYQRFIASVASTARMEMMGLNVDLEVSQRLRDTWKAKSEEATKGLRQIYEVKQFEAERGERFNIASGEHVGEALAVYGKVDLPKTPGGKQYATDDDTLRKTAPDNPLVHATLAFRESEKTISTYLDPIAAVPLIYKTGLLHPSYTTMLTATTRLSSNDPNIQNFPKRKHKELREQVVAPPDHFFAAFDYGQLEARVIAMASRDKNLMSGIINGRDIHSDWLNNCLNIYPDYLQRLGEETNQTEEKKIRKYGRDIIKTDFVFASFFGSSANSVATRTRIPRHLVDALHSEFWREFSGVAAWIKQRRQEYRDTGNACLLNGIIRHGILSGNEPINTPIQGTGACIVVEAMNELSQLSIELDDPAIHPRINIHDDLIFCLPDDENLDLRIQSIMEVMVAVRFPWQTVPLMVEGRLGVNWADLEEFTKHTGDYVR
jgi:DNA polymerase I-like protein with 3'-5' exonuclease and polymerase domains/uracil-DNA glycosylase